MPQEVDKRLVIVESPAKARAIHAILGNRFRVRASMGHVRDLPQRALGVDVDHGFSPRYEVIKNKQKTVKALKDAARDVSCVYLAPDPDREGEAIAWHLQQLLSDLVPEDQFYRVSYNEITEAAIKEAFAHPGRIQPARIASQQARRVLDRLVGYKVSPLLWKRFRGANSAGRVQSVALRLICEREAEIRAFVKRVYWLLGARLCKPNAPDTAFNARLIKVDGVKGEFDEEAIAERCLQALEKSRFAVVKVRTRDIRKRPRPPFITSTLQQAASTACRYSPARTMRIAQRLYEGIEIGGKPKGLITYMRTDSVAVSKQARSQAADFIRKHFGPEYVPERPHVFQRRKAAQEAHEAIRPADVTLRPDDLQGVLPPEEMKLYRLIWNRFVASQMAAGVVVQRSVDIEARPDAVVAAGDPANYLFRASAAEVRFPGYMAVSGVDVKGSSRGEGNDADAGQLPPLQEGDPLDCLECQKEEKETKPPPRYNEASLIRVLEENGVGRPSTFAAILSTLQVREYVALEDRVLFPTDLGEKVNAFLVEHLGSLFDVPFTAAMEAQLDAIEEGRVSAEDMLRKFYKDLRAWIDEARTTGADQTAGTQLLALLEKVRHWQPPRKQGRQVFSDQEFVESLRKQQEAGAGKLTERQIQAMVRLVARYSEELPAWREVTDALKLTSAIEKVAAEPPPDERTLRKLKALEPVAFEPARKVGKRVFNDRDFVDSLRSQAQSGRALSPKQADMLDRFLIKYADQLGGRDTVERNFDIESAPTENLAAEGMLALLEKVQQWSKPVKRGRRTWDDQAFYDSLKGQHKEGRVLSPRQQAALLRMLQRYADQIEGYEQAMAGLGLPAVPAPRAVKGGKSASENED